MSLDIKLHKEDLPAEINFKNIDRIAVDCEFMGLNVNRDKLCLVQISTGNQEAHIIQLNKNSYNAPNLKKILENNKIKKIFHFARADMAFIKYYLKINIKNVECTKIMSKLARSYSSAHGLKDLVKEFIGIDISKQMQNSDFGGNLSDKQLKYCANDVIYLNIIYEKLNEILIREKRIDLYESTKQFLQVRVDLDLSEFKEDIWAH